MDYKSPTQTLSSSNSGGVKKEWTVVMRERIEEKLPWPLIKRGFTEAQRRELQEQQVINTHISAGLPVPLHLVLPIWKSVVSSLGPSSSLLIYKQYPSFSGYILSGFDCKNMTHPEPGRCRRTDGKKWRCSRAVISEQKYCERHIHRGRRRSRKLVEASEFASPSGNTSTNSSITSTAAGPSKPDSPQIPNPNHSGVSVGLQLMTPSSSNVTIASHGYERVRPYIVSHGTVASASTPAWTSHYNNNNIVARSNTPPGLGFWPKTVMQVAGCGGPFLGNRAHAVFEPMRCRRTDGKKWRCMKEVVTGQKYCPRHMHRGAKRLSQSFVPMATSAAPPPRPPVADIRADPNTNLCISIPTSPPPKEKSSSTTSSDTTVTDTSN